MSTERSRGRGRTPVPEGLRVPLADLQRRTASRRRWQTTVRLDGLRVADTEIRAGTDIELDLELESVHNGVVACGDITSRWDAACNRCLEPVDGTVSVDIREVFEVTPTDGESYPLGTEELDLEPMVRDALLLGLPLVATCERPDGEPPCVDPTVSVGDAGADDEVGDDRLADPRWAALDQLSFDDHP